MPADDDATAAAARALVTALTDAPIDHISVSPRQRCLQLARAVQALRPQVRLRIDPRLAEMDFGCWEGQSWDAIGRDALEAWSADFGTYPPGGGEAVDTLLARVGAAFDEAAANAGGRDVFWITHAGVARAAVLWQAGCRGLADAGAWPREGLAFGAWQRLRLP